MLLIESIRWGLFACLTVQTPPPLPLIERMLGDRMTEDDIRAIVGSIGSELRSRDDDVRARMIVLYVRWREAAAEAGRFEPERYEAYRQNMLILLSEHREAMIRAMELIRSVAPLHTQELDAMQRKIELDYHERTLPRSGRGFGWPDPTDDFQPAVNGAENAAARGPSGSRHQ